MPGALGLDLLHRLRDVGAFEDWIARPAAENLPRQIIARRAHPSRDDGDLLSERLRTATRRTQRLSHPSVRHCFGVAEGEGQAVQLLEHLPGLSLTQLFEHQRLPTVTAVWVARQILEALAYAHALDSGHRNLDPDAIWLSAQGLVYCDFGLSGGANDDPRLTVAINLRYTRLAWAGRNDISSAWLDVHAAAVLLWEMLTGEVHQDFGNSSSRQPSTDAPPALVQTLRNILTGPPVPAKTFADQLAQKFYVDLDAEDIRDGQTVLARAVEQIIGAQTTPPGPDRPHTLEIRFSEALLRREGPVLPSDLTGDDHDSVPQDSTWAPGQVIGDATPSPPEQPRAELPTLVSVARPLRPQPIPLPLPSTPLAPSRSMAASPSGLIWVTALLLCLVAVLLATLALTGAPEPQPVETRPLSP